jgi:hypothetical protein
MGAEGTRKRQWEADNNLIGPASRALATPARAKRARLPSLHGSAFDEEERNTDSEINNVLGGIKSVPPKPLAEPVIAASEAAHEPSASEAPVSPEAPLVQMNPPNEDARSPIEPSLATHRPPVDATTVAFDLPQAPSVPALQAQRKRQLIVVTAVWGLAAIILALTAAWHIARTQVAPAQATKSAPSASSLTPAVDALSTATPTVPPSAATAQTPAATPKTNAASRRPPSKRGHTPSSI